MKKALRVLVRVVLVLVVVLVAAVLIVAARLGPVIKQAVNTVGPQVMGVPVKVESVVVKPLRGIVDLRGLEIGNPEGFSTPHLFALGHLRVELEPRSLLGDVIHVKLVSIEAPHVWYERTLKGSNVEALQKQLGGDGESAKPAADEAGGGAKKKRVVIDRVEVRDGKVGVKVGVGAALPLPTIVLTDIGKEEGGASLLEATQRILGAILKGVLNCVSALGELAVDGVKAVGEGAVEGVKQVGQGVQAAGKAAGDAIKGLGGLLKREPAKPATP